MISRRSFFKKLAALSTTIALAPELAFHSPIKNQFEKHCELPMDVDRDAFWTVKSNRSLYSIKECMSFSSLERVALIAIRK